MNSTSQYSRSGVEREDVLMLKAEWTKKLDSCQQEDQRREEPITKRRNESTEVKMGGSVKTLCVPNFDSILVTLAQYNTFFFVSKRGQRLSCPNRSGAVQGSSGWKGNESRITIGDDVGVWLMFQIDNLLIRKDNILPSPAGSLTGCQLTLSLKLMIAEDQEDHRIKGGGQQTAASNNNNRRLERHLFAPLTKSGFVGNNNGPFAAVQRHPLSSSFKRYGAYLWAEWTRSIRKTLLLTVLAVCYVSLFAVNLLSLWIFNRLRQRAIVDGQRQMYEKHLIMIAPDFLFVGTSFVQVMRQFLRLSDWWPESCWLTAMDEWLLALKGGFLFADQIIILILCLGLNRLRRRQQAVAMKIQLQQQQQEESAAVTVGAVELEPTITTKDSGKISSTDNCNSTPTTIEMSPENRRRLLIGITAAFLIISPLFSYATTGPSLVIRERTVEEKCRQISPTTLSNRSSSSAATGGDFSDSAAARLITDDETSAWIIPSVHGHGGREKDRSGVVAGTEEEYGFQMIYVPKTKHFHCWIVNVPPVCTAIGVISRMLLDLAILPVIIRSIFLFRCSPHFSLRVRPSESKISTKPVAEQEEDGCNDQLTTAQKQQEGLDIPDYDGIECVEIPKQQQQEGRRLTTTTTTNTITPHTRAALVNNLFVETTTNSEDNKNSRIQHSSHSSPVSKKNGTTPSKSSTTPDEQSSDPQSRTEALFCISLCAEAVMACSQLLVMVAILLDMENQLFRHLMITVILLEMANHFVCSIVFNRSFRQEIRKLFRQFGILGAQQTTNTYSINNNDNRNSNMRPNTLHTIQDERILPVRMQTRF